MTNPKSQDLVSRLREVVALEKDATPGPWKQQPQRGHTDDYILTEHPDYQAEGTWASYIGECGLAGGQVEQKFSQNAALIVALRNSTSDISKAADEIERLTKELADLDWKPIDEIAKRFVIVGWKQGYGVETMVWDREFGGAWVGGRYQPTHYKIVRPPIFEDARQALSGSTP